MYDYDLVVVGGGVSAYSFLKGLEKNKNFLNKKIALIYPSDYLHKIKVKNISDISPKFLQTKNILSLSYFLNTLEKYKEDSFTTLGVHGIGGMARIWGASIGTFSKDDLEKNGMDYREFQTVYKEIGEFIPYSGNSEDVLTQYFELKRSKSVTVSKKIKKLFGNYVDNSFKIGNPRLLIKENCNDCNQCLSGCDLDSIWYPTKSDFMDIQNLNITIIDDGFVYNIDNSRLFYQRGDASKEFLDAEKIVLACGSIHTYKLLCNSTNIKNTEAKLLSTPAFSFAFLDITRNDKDKFFGMGNATFLIDKNDKIEFYGNLYDGYSLSLSTGRVFSKNFYKDFIFKLLSRFTVAGAGFISSDYIETTLEYKNETIYIKSKLDENYNSKMKMVLDVLKDFLKEKGTFLVHKKFTKSGADIHYAGGIPKELYKKDYIVNGKLKGIDNILVVGGSNFSYLPPQSPTLAFMANSYRIGKNLKENSV
jgi:hypothetical protein